MAGGGDSGGGDSGGGGSSSYGGGGTAGGTSGGGGSSFGAMGFNAAGAFLKGYGEASSQKFLAARDRRSAEYGKIKADQVDTARREELATTLGNIDVMRSAGNVDYLSPTTAVIKEHQGDIADRQRLIERGNILAQAREDELSAAYRDKAAKRSMTGAYLGAIGSFVK